MVAAKPFWEVYAEQMAWPLLCPRVMKVFQQCLLFPEAAVVEALLVSVASEV